MSDFAELVRGRTVAIVGRAPILDGDAERIDAHDIVYRTAETPSEGRWGSRTDAVFFPWATARDIYQRRSQDLLERLRDVPWWVYKGKPREVRREGLWRVAKWPNIRNPNAVTLMIYDLIRYHEPASVTVFAADLYAAGPGKSYDPTLKLRDEYGCAKGIIQHRPFEQLKVHRACVKTGKIVGDARYLAAATMTDEQYRPIIDAWHRLHRSEPSAA